MRFSRSYILNNNLKLKKIKSCQPEEINKDYDVQKIKLKDIMKDRKFRMILTIFEPYRITWWYFTKQNIN